MQAAVPLETPSWLSCPPASGLSWARRRQTLPWHEGEGSWETARTRTRGAGCPPSAPKEPPRTQAAETVRPKVGVQGSCVPNMNFLPPGCSAGDRTLNFVWGLQDGSTGAIMGRGHGIH